MTRFALAFIAGVIGLFLSAKSLLPQDREFELDGPPVHVQVDDIALCVGRRFIEPSDLKRWNEGIRPVTAGHLYRRSVPLALFTEALTGYSDAQYRDGIATVYDKRRYPPDWIRIDILPKGSRRRVLEAPGDYLQTFVDDWTLDGEFRSHKRRPDCVGKSVVWGALSAVTLGPECLDTEIKYGHPAATNVVLYCNPKRCYTSNYLNVGEVTLEYDFPRQFLDNWATLHFGILKRVSGWRADMTCVN